MPHLFCFVYSGDLNVGAAQDQKFLFFHFGFCIYNYCDNSVLFFRSSGYLSKSSIFLMMMSICIIWSSMDLKNILESSSFQLSEITLDPRFILSTPLGEPSV